jgi:ComF family protein
MSSASWLTQVRSLTNDAFNLIFPPVCALCRKEGEILCQNCRADIPWVKEPICPACGRILAEPAASCPICLDHPLPLQTIRAAVVFEGGTPEAVHQMKYNGFFALAQPLADMMVEAWWRWQSDVDLVMPIPLHPRRQKKRGYNQSELLVKRFCQRLNLAHDMRSLRRLRATPPQVGLNAVERRLNVQDAFTVLGDGCVGRHVLLVDDVCTTGSTLAAAAEVLLAAGAYSVSAYCVARAT